MKNNFSFFDRKSQKWPKNSQKWSKMTKSENFRPKFLKKIFFSESIQNVSKRILNRKSRFRKFFPVENFSLGLYHFWRKWPKSEKISGQKITKMSFRRVSQRALKRPIFKIFWPSLRSGRLRRLCRYVSSATGRRGITLTSKEDAGKPIPPSSSPEIDPQRVDFAQTLMPRRPQKLV